MKISEADFWLMTPSTFFKMSEHHIDRQTRLFRDDWERTRYQTRFIVSMFAKKGSKAELRKIFKFPWDDEVLKGKKIKPKKFSKEEHEREVAEMLRESKKLKF